jgi:hypothetical protein
MTASFNLRTGLARVTVNPLDGSSQRVITDYNFRNSVCPPPGFGCAAKE